RARPVVRRNRPLQGNRRGVLPPAVLAGAARPAGNPPAHRRGAPVSAAERHPFLRPCNREGRRMKLTIPRDNLRRGLEAVSGAVPTRTTLPVLNHVKLEAEDGKLRLETTNLDTHLSFAVDAEV